MNIQTCDNSDQYFMSLAINLAKKGQFTARPNPCVGCVIVKDDHIIGQGYHQKAGTPHAEVWALEDACRRGFDVVGATAYVTLEPCNHYGRTPPCSQALIRANIGRVVIAVPDSNNQATGGIRALEQAGIQVSTHIGYDKAYALNKGFFKAMTQKIPYVRLKMGISLDGRIAMANGQSKWITGDLARQDVQKLRAMSGAIITGSQTMIADTPQLLVREPSYFDDVTQPMLVILDRTKRLQIDDKCLIYQKNRPLWLMQESLELPQILQRLCNDYQIYDVLVETGAILASSFLEQGLVDELVIYQAPCLLGNRAKPMFDGSFDKICEQLRFSLVSHETIGDDVKLVFQK